MTASRLLAVLVLALPLTGCGSSEPSTIESVNSAADATIVASNWAMASADLAGYCLDQAVDGSGDPSVAESATDRMVNIARAHAQETYDIDGVTYRQALSDKASDLQDCDADLTAKLDRALATLD